MEQHIQDEIIEMIKVRNCPPKAQVELLVGAMQMYQILNPDSAEDGSWCPPAWVIGVMRGRDFRKEEEA